MFLHALILVQFHDILGTYGLIFIPLGATPQDTVDKEIKRITACRCRRED